MDKIYLNSAVKLLLLFVFLIPVATSCGDKCENVICENGYCIKGDCFCLDGYSGENCTIKESDKFAGEYIGTLTAFGHSQPGTEMSIRTYDDNPWKILISLDNSNGVDFTIRAHVDKNLMFIENQFIEKDDVYNLIYPSTATLENESILNFDLNVKTEGQEKFVMRVEMKKEE